MENEDLDQRKQGLDRAKRWRSIPRESGHFLYHQIITHRPKIIVEIGTSHGFSTSWMGLAASIYGGKVHTYEISKWRYDQATSNFKDLELEETIHQYLVDDNINFPDGIDMVFIDAEKSDYISHLQKLEDKLNPGAVIFADNTVSHKEELSNYVSYVRNHPDFVSYSNPIGKGIETTRKLLKNEKIKEIW